MKITKISMRITRAVACATAFLIGAAPITAFAHTGPEAECICESKCAEDHINEDCPVCKEDYTLCQGEEEIPCDVVEEPMGPLTPDGNMTLVDDYGSIEAGGKQFITVVTKSGNYFYIIIDRDDQGDETVHFLNMVDESDLLALMDEDEQKAYLESLDVEPKDDSDKDTSEETITPEEPEKVEEKKSPSVSPAAIVALIIFLGAGGFMGYKYLKEKNPKKESVNPDPDEDYSEDEDDYLTDSEVEIEDISAEDTDLEDSGEDDTE